MATKIQLAWEVLPDLQGAAHAVDYDPDTLYNEYQVSLCGKTLVAKGGHIEDTSKFCSVCQDVSHERQAEFDRRNEEVLV